jgi:signal transduction histidine kinase
MEALHNAAKHARARRVHLGASAEAGLWRLWVEDDGIGIRPAAPPPRSGGLGLPGMRGRAAEIGGRLTIGPAAGGPSGTRVEIALPAPRFVALRFAPRLSSKLRWRTSRS